MSRPAASTVVIVDDNDLMRSMLRGILRSEEAFEVIGEARDGEVAVNLVKRLQPDIVCMDVMMPKMTGLDALREIKIAQPAVAVVMVSGNASPENVQEAVFNGAVGFIVKPFNAAQVLKTMAGVQARLKAQ